MCFHAYKTYIRRLDRFLRSFEFLLNFAIFDDFSILAVITAKIGKSSKIEKLSKIQMILKIDLDIVYKLYRHENTSKESQEHIFCNFLYFRPLRADSGHILHQQKSKKSRKITKIDIF